MNFIVKILFGARTSATPVKKQSRVNLLYSISNFKTKPVKGGKIFGGVSKGTVLFGETVPFKKVYELLAHLNTILQNAFLK